MGNESTVINMTKRKWTYTRTGSHMYTQRRLVLVHVNMHILKWHISRLCVGSLLQTKIISYAIANTCGCFHTLLNSFSFTFFIVIFCHAQILFTWDILRDKEFNSIRFVSKTTIKMQLWDFRRFKLWFRNYELLIPKIMCLHYGKWCIVNSVGK